MNMNGRKDPGFESAQRLAALLAKEYSRDFFRLLVMYRDISASEAAARLSLHVKTAQDFLEGLEAAGILSKREAAEKKRPYFRFSLRERRLEISVDLDALHDSKDESTRWEWPVRERKASGALFKEGRDNRISAVHVYEGTGRSRTEKRLSLTECQGRFLFHLPFPTENFARVSEIAARAGVERDRLPEVVDLVDLLLKHGVIAVKNSENQD
jgi:predicted transcriptional regulator